MEFFKEKEKIILNLYPEELFLESIIDFLKKKDIKNACVLSGIGTLKKLVYHRVLTTDFPPKNEFITVNGPLELSSVQGLIINYEPHLHFVASDLERTYSGHLEMGSQVLYLSEIFMIALDEFSLERINKKGISYIERRG